MKRALPLLLIFLGLFTDARAYQWEQERYLCSLTIPDEETWSPHIPQTLSIGEMIYTATFKQLEQSIAVVVIPNISSADMNLKSPGIISRVLDVLKDLGYSTSKPNEVTIDQTRFLEVVGKRGDPLGRGEAAVARAIFRDDTIYVAIATGPGGEERAKDSHFLRVLNTFKLIEPSVKKIDPARHPFFQKYRMAYKASWVGAMGLLGLSLVVVLFSRRKG